MGIAELIAPLFGGGLTGLLGSVAQRIFEYKTKQLEHQAELDRFGHEVELRRVDAQIMVQEAAAKLDIARTEAAGQEAAADSDAFKAAITAEPPRYSDQEKASPAQEWLLVLVDVLRASVRPFLTVYLCTLTTLIYLQARRLITTGLSPEEALGLTKTVVNTILYLTSTSVLFYFGTRNKQPRPRV